MRVIIEAALLVSAQARADPLALLTLFRLGMARACHCIEVDPVDPPELRAWMQTLTEEQQEYITFLIDEGAKRQVREPPARSIRVADLPQPDWSAATSPRVPLEVALALMQRPLRILLEGVHDEHFLRSVVPAIYREQFETWLKEDSLQLEYRGGLDSLHQAVKQECREPGKRLRLFVMFDSDAHRRGESSGPSKELKRTCQRMSLAHHQLQRRAIDNYLTKQALERWLQKTRGRERDKWRPKLQALHHPQVTAEQRHHYNMKKGLLGDLKGGGVAEIYTGLEPALTAELQSGFGEDVAKAFEDTTPEDWLRNDGQLPELMEVFTQLLRAA